MTAPEATRLAAIIAGSIALLSVAINVASAWLIRWQERRAKESDWLRDKQVRDVEEIVTTLTVFSRDFRSCIESLEAGQVDALKDVHTLDEIFRRTQSSDLSSSRLLHRYYDSYEKDSAKILVLNTRTRDWFSGEVKRLSLWFDESDGVEVMLNDIGERVQAFHVSIYQTSRELWAFVVDFFEVEDERYIDVGKAERLHSAFLNAASEWGEVDVLIFAAQKRLAERYKPTKTTSAQRLASDSLLVKVARWTEARLRWLLRMR